MTRIVRPIVPTTAAWSRHATARLATALAAAALVLTAVLVLAAVVTAPASAGPYVNPTPAQIRAKLSAAAVARSIPPKLVYAIAYQESTWRQFDANGDPLISKDGGIGIMQVTTIPVGVDAVRLRTDIDYNIAVGADILLAKWGYAPSVFPVIGAGSTRCYEDWFFAVWAYNGLTANNQYPYKIWAHLADGHGLWTGARGDAGARGVAGEWAAARGGEHGGAAAGTLVEPDAAAQAAAERAARPEEGRGGRQVHRLRHALAAASGRRALGGTAAVTLERLKVGAPPHRGDDQS